MKTAIYARVSTSASLRLQDTLNQLAPLREQCRAHSWEVVGEYIDQVSGSGTKRRSEFERLLADAQAGKFERLLFWSLDRLSREGVSKTLGYLEKLDSWGVCWISHTEPYLDSCGVFKDAVLAILAVVAKQERLRISERVKAGLDIARSQGRRGGRPKAIPDAGLIARVRDLRDQSFAFEQIAALTGVSKSQAHRLAQL